jgi:hypothetical protein
MYASADCIGCILWSLDCKKSSGESLSLVYYWNDLDCSGDDGGPIGRPIFPLTLLRCSEGLQCVAQEPLPRVQFFPLELLAQ